MLDKGCYFALLVILCLIITACRPPLELTQNKAKRFKSTKAKNASPEIDGIFTDGVYLSTDLSCTNSNYLLFKLNKNQTVQLSNNTPKAIREVKLNNSNLLNLLDNKVAYYYYITTDKQTLILERFEYWDSPWWNFFVQVDHYLVEKFTILGDTLVNNEQGRFTRFCKSYVLDPSLTANFNVIENEFIKVK